MKSIGSTQTYMIFFLMSLWGLAALAGGSTCRPPQDSQWNWSLEKLVEKTNDVILVKLVEKKKSGLRPSIGPDFAIQSGIAAHGRRDKKGKRKTHLDDIWDSTEWTFQIVEPLKGKLKAGDKYKLISIQAGEGRLMLSDTLCDYALNFEADKAYLIFVNSYHPNGYLEASEANSATIEKVRKLLGKL